MCQLYLFVLVFFFLLFFKVKAQSAVVGQYGTSSPDVVTAFKPSLAVVIGILSVMFFLTFILLIYAKFCHPPAAAEEQENHQGLIIRSRRFSGIDKTVIESLPFFRFSSLKGSKEGLECAVCLSKFEDIEILRLLPKCKHAFHINCIDKWLEKHSSCPLCRIKVSVEDPEIFAYSNSLRFLWDQTEQGEDSNLEIFVRREENRVGCSSRFSIGRSSFRKTEKDKKEEETPIQQGNNSDDEEKNCLHKFNHKIVISDVVFKNRWSNVSSSDLMFLNSEMLNAISSEKFDSNTAQFETTRGIENVQVMNIKEEVERKRLFECKVSKYSAHYPSTSDSQKANTNDMPRSLIRNEKRSMSEITGFSRFGDLRSKIRFTTESSCLPENNVKEERMRQLWLPIARRTVQWFANRERRSPLPQSTRESLDV